MEPMVVLLGQPTAGRRCVGVLVLGAWRHIAAAGRLRAQRARVMAALRMRAGAVAAVRAWREQSRGGVEWQLLRLRVALVFHSKWLRSKVLRVSAAC
jgi:hypothetical protein